jgi:hypothetical protein
MMLARGVILSHETVRQWCAKFGQTYANNLRRRRPCPGDKWHLDEVFITINGQRQYLWRAVDQHGNVLDILVTSRWDTRAATRFFRKLLTGLEYVPRVLITDKLASYGAARRRVLRSVEHRQSKYLNNRGREFASTDPGAGTSDEEVHLSQACPAVPVRLQWYLPAFSARPSPALRRRVPPRNDRAIHHLEPDHRHDHSSLTHHTEDRPGRSNHAHITKQPSKLTMPAGMLALYRAEVAAADSRPGDVGPALEYAAELAERTGEGNAYWLGFGPSNTGFCRVSVALDLKDYDMAVSAAQGVDPRQHSNPSRRAAYWTYYGRALARVRGRHDNAVRALRTAELIVPHRVQRDPFAREVIGGLLGRVRRDSPAGRELRGMAYRAGLSV